MGGKKSASTITTKPQGGGHQGGGPRSLLATKGKHSPALTRANGRTTETKTGEQATPKGVSQARGTHGTPTSPRPGQPGSLDALGGAASGVGVGTTKKQ